MQQMWIALSHFLPHNFALHTFERSLKFIYPQRFRFFMHTHTRDSRSRSCFFLGRQVRYFLCGCTTRSNVINWNWPFALACAQFINIYFSRLCIRISRVCAVHCGMPIRWHGMACLVWPLRMLQFINELPLCLWLGLCLTLSSIQINKQNPFA